MLGTLRYGMQQDSVQLVCGPLYHNGPFTQSMMGIFLGHHIVVLPRFDPVAALEAIETYRVEWVNLVPTMMLRMWRILADHPNRYDLSSLKLVWHMAAPCPAWLKEEWMCLVGEDKVMELYSATEAVASTVISGREWKEHRGSVGKPVNGKMRILDSEGRGVLTGEIGEIFMRGEDNTPPPYHYIGAESRTINGWESFGDLGWFDRDGYLYLSDRRTDLILSGGANVYPAEVESALLEHPSVESCVVIGLPDDDLGQRVHAVIQTRNSVSDDELREFLFERIVGYKIPRSFRFVSEPLRDDAGKIRRGTWRDEEVSRLRVMQDQNAKHQDWLDS
jgi:bile acid-coenzyme A ligase